MKKKTRKQQLVFNTNTKIKQIEKIDEFIRKLPEYLLSKDIESLVTEAEDFESNSVYSLIIGNE